MFSVDLLLAQGVDVGRRPASKTLGGLNGAAGQAVPKQELKLWECGASLNFWLLFAVFGMGTGTGLMFVNNLGAQLDSLTSQPCVRMACIAWHDICSAVVCAHIHSHRMGITS